MLYRQVNSHKNTLTQKMLHEMTAVSWGNILKFERGGMK